MVLIWDYNKKELKKSKPGRLLMLERMINFGPSRREKIKLSDVKKHWSMLNLFAPQRRLLELMIWKKQKPSTESRKSYWMK